jgi:hypothetical protein
MGGAIARIVCLGASNLTLGLPALAAAARCQWGAGVELLAAAGLGRSYGAPSRVLLRTLPGILAAGLWRALERLPAAATRAVITDVGNDILYGFGERQIIAWVGEALRRLERTSAERILVAPPMESIRRLTPGRYLLARSLFYPACRLPLERVLASTAALDAGLERLAARSGARLVRPDPAWYGFDPIHIRRSRRAAAWRKILGVTAPPREDAAGSLLEAMRLQAMAPERQTILGIARFRPQRGAALPSGGRLWLY